jgi:flagellar basal-body rod modification protein FlgD
MTTPSTSVSNPAQLTSIASSVDASRTRLADSEQTFMKLLTTQLRNQDPLSPMDSTQFTQQLVQMTSVEQQIYGNQLLENLVGQGGGNLTNSVGLIGRQITAQSAHAGLSGGHADWAYNLPTSAGDATVEVLDSSGRVVRTVAGQTAAGSHTFTWDGKNDAGQTQPDGDYTLLVAAHGADGQPIAATTYVTGVVSAVQTVNGATQLTVGPTQIPLSAVTGVARAAD